MISASVIIPTFNRKENLKRLLESLALKNGVDVAFEVIIVDDGSMDGTEQVANNNYPFPVQYLRQENQGSAAARNLGAECATGDVLIFLDDDMLVEREFVSGLLQEHRNFERIVGMGSLRPFQNPEDTLFTRTYPFDETLLKQPVFPDDMDAGENHGQFVAFTDCVTNNLSIRREDFFMIGGMQDVAGDGPTWWGDVDFGYRAHLHGLRFRRSARAFCTHCDKSVKDLDSAITRQYKASFLAVALFRKFPELQEQVPMFNDMLPIDWRKDPVKRIARKMLRGLVSTWLSIRILTGIARISERRYPSPALLRPLYRWILGGYVYQGYREGLRKYGRPEQLHPVIQAR